MFAKPPGAGKVCPVVILLQRARQTADSTTRRPTCRWPTARESEMLTRMLPVEYSKQAIRSRPPEAEPSLGKYPPGFVWSCYVVRPRLLSPTPANHDV